MEKQKERQETDFAVMADEVMAAIRPARSWAGSSPATWARKASRGMAPGPRAASEVEYVTSRVAIKAFVECVTP